MATFFLSGCAIRPYMMDQTAQTLAGPNLSNEDDLQLARESSAFYLKLSESVLRERPGHLKLAESVAAGFTQYAYAFVVFDAEKNEKSKPQLAAQYRDRAARMYARAHRHAMAALEADQPGFSEALIQLDPKKRPHLVVEQVPLVYWASASLAGWISMSKDDPDLVADFPLAIRLAELAWQIEPTYGHGALASLLGTYESARVGGSRIKSENYFKQAILWSHEEDAGPYVGMAESIAIPTQNKIFFKQLLQQAVVISQKHRNLQNEVMRDRAQWLLSITDDLF